MGTSLNGLTPANTYQALIKVGNNTNLNTTLKTLSDGAGNDLPMQASTTAINFTGTVSGVASGVSGAIQFSNGSAFASDANNLFWDDANNRLGIGTSTPSTTLQVGGSVRFGTGSVGTSLFWDNTNGRLSIGSSLTPSYPLEVNGQSFFNENIIIANGDGIKFWVDKVRIKPPTTDSLGFYTGTTSGSPSERMRITSAGDVGINTTSPSARTHIVGSGSTSATTSLLVQNSDASQLLKVTDDGILYCGIGATLRFYGGPYPRIRGYNNITIEDDTFVHINCVYADNTRLLRQTIVGADTANNASAQLQIDSTTKGFLPPRMTTTQKNAIASPAEGLQMYDSTAKSPAYYDGTNWGYTGGALQNAAGNSGTLNISFAAGNIVNLTLNANTTLAFSNAVIGTYIIQVTQGATGANVLTYPASVKWAGGTAPTLTTTVGKTDILTFYYDGTSYYGNYSLNY